MNDLKVIISSPHEKNLYSLLAAQICIDEPGIQLVGVSCLKVLSFRRILFEIKRLGPKLLKKILDKYFLKINDTQEQSNALQKEYDLKANSLREMCKKANIKFKKISDPNDQQSIDFYSSIKPDLIISIGSVILRENIISVPRLGILNVHQGILPKYRGMGVTEWPLLVGSKDGDIELGVTSHLIEQGVDTGPVIFVERLNFNELDDIGDLEPYFLRITLKAMQEGLKSAKKGFSNIQIQNEKGGKQYFDLHHRLKDVAENRMRNYINGK